MSLIFFLLRLCYRRLVVAARTAGTASLRRADLSSRFLNKGASAWGWSLFFRFRSKSVPQKSAYARGFDLRSNSVPQQVAKQQEQQDEIKPCELVLYWKPVGVTRIVSALAREPLYLLREHKLS